MYNLPILTYHKISNDKEFGLTTITPRKFREQIEYLVSEGYESIGFNQLLDQTPLPDKPIIITFDDGYENVYTNAFPILSEFKFKCVVFLVTDYFGKYNLWESASIQKKHKHMSINQVIELKEAGCEIGSHSRKHNYLPSLNENDLADEIGGSKRDLEKIIRDRVISFSYPYGRYNSRVIQAIQNADYAFATTNMRLYKKSPNNPLTLSRRSIYSTDTLKLFKDKLNGHNRFSSAHLSEFLIQRGALASIGLNLIRTHFVKF